MSALTDDQVKEAAKNEAAEHGVCATAIVLAPSIASSGEPALEIRYVLPSGSVITASSSVRVSQSSWRWQTLTSINPDEAEQLAGGAGDVAEGGD
jgi:hypothetical protein